MRPNRMGYEDKIWFTVAFTPPVSENIINPLYFVMDYGDAASIKMKQSDVDV